MGDTPKALPLRRTSRELNVFPSQRAGPDRLRVARDRSAPGGVIGAVVPDSPADRAGLRPGDRVMVVNGHPLWDVLDYQYYAAEDRVDLQIRRPHPDGDRDLRITIVADEPLGIEFAESTFDGVRVCANNCPFCFVHQNRRGMRRSVYIKDDDYRYSALYGGFITLTNLKDEDWQRISEQRLSPLNVSVHATDLELRRRLLGNPRAPDVLDQIRRLADLNIQVNTQVVLCPGWNDGEHLDRTIDDLAALFPHVRTLSIVPVGLTDYGIKQVTEMRRHRPDEARDVVTMVRRRQRAFRARFGVGFVYCSDEFFLMAGLRIPSAHYYDGYPQYTNGVGMVRSMRDEWARLRRQVARVRTRRATIVSGTLAAPVLQPIVAELGERVDCDLRLVAAENRFFGPSVTVSGLLTGYDLLNALDGRSPADLGDRLILPRLMLDVEGVRFLDDRTPAQIASALATPVSFASTLHDLVDALDEAPEVAVAVPTRPIADE